MSTRYWRESGSRPIEDRRAAFAEAGHPDLVDARPTDERLSFAD
jgi:hypothetical protein